MENGVTDSFERGLPVDGGAFGCSRPSGSSDADRHPRPGPALAANSQALAAFQRAAQTWASVLADTANLWSLSTGFNNGDGRQSGHFKDDLLGGSYIGIMDPTFVAGTFESPTEADFRALDLIGWNVLPVPEPSTAVFAGLGALAIVRRRDRSALRRGQPDA